MSGNTTVNVLDNLGSQVYEWTVARMQINESLARMLLDSSLSTVGLSRDKLTIDDLGAMLPEIESRLRRFIDPQQASDVMRRLHQMIFAWQEPAE